MNTRDDRDQSVDDLLRQSLQADASSAAPGSACLDAETLGAWAEGGLGENGVAMVEAHLSECARCQRIVAVLGKLPAAAPQLHRSWWWQWGVDLRWFVPLAAGATAVALWVAVPGREGPQSVVPLQAPEQSAVGGPQAAADSRQPAVDSRQSTVGSRQSVASSPPLAAEVTPAAAPAPQVAGGVSEKAVDAVAERRDARNEAESPRAFADSVGRVTERVAAAPPAAPSAAAAAEVLAGRTDTFALGRQASVIGQEVVSPTPLVRWRVGPRGLIQYSASGGAAWEQLSADVAADLTAGASPSSTVCWVVGRAGTVLLTVDGRRFDRRPFPTNVDLTAVRATDARTAVVTTADGRAFSTSDGGSTWTQ